MKIVDERETQKTAITTITKKQRQKRARGDQSYSEKVTTKWLCYAFKLAEACCGGV